MCTRTCKKCTQNKYTCGKISREYKEIQEYKELGMKREPYDNL